MSYRPSYERDYARGGLIITLFTLFLWFMFTVVPTVIVCYIAWHFIAKFW